MRNVLSHWPPNEEAKTLFLFKCQHPKKISPSNFPFFHSTFQQLYKLKHNNRARDFLFHGAKCPRKLHMVVSQHVPSLYCLEPYLEWLYEMMAKAGGQKLGVRKVWTRAAWWTRDEREWLLTVRLLGKESREQKNRTITAYCLLVLVRASRWTSFVSTVLRTCNDMWASELDHSTVERQWPGIRNRIFWDILWMPGVCVMCLSGKEMAPGCILGERQAGRDSVRHEILQKNFYPAIPVDATTDLNVVAEQAHPGSRIPSHQWSLSTG